MIEPEDKRGFWRWLWEETIRESKAAIVDYFAPLKNLRIFFSWEGLALVTLPIVIWIAALIARPFWTQ